MAVEPSSRVSWYTRFVDTIALSSDDPHEAPGIAVVVPRRVDDGSVASLGRIHGIAHHARIAQVTVGVPLAATMSKTMPAVMKVL